MDSVAFPGWSLDASAEVSAGEGLVVKLSSAAARAGTASLRKPNEAIRIIGVVLSIGVWVWELRRRVQCSVQFLAAWWLWWACPCPWCSQVTRGLNGLNTPFGFSR